MFHQSSARCRSKEAYGESTDSGSWLQGDQVIAAYLHTPTWPLRRVLYSQGVYCYEGCLPWVVHTYTVRRRVCNIKVTLRKWREYTRGQWVNNALGNAYNVLWASTEWLQGCSYQRASRTSGHAWRVVQLWAHHAYERGTQSLSHQSSCIWKSPCLCIGFQLEYYVRECMCVQ